MDESCPSRILWRCRRGTRELDLVLTGFVEKRYMGLEAADKGLFEEMLELQDTRLIEWLLYGQPPDPPYQALVDDILRVTGNR